MGRVLSTASTPHW